MDDIQDAAAALRALASDGTKVTKKTARLRQLLPEIDALQAAGISHVHILEALNKNGFDLKMSAYSSMLWRIRHGKSKTVKPAPAVPIAQVVTDGPVGEGSPEPEANIQVGQFDLEESRKRREDKANRFIGTGRNPLIKKN
jgi:hypothetical protein